MRNVGKVSNSTGLSELVPSVILVILNVMDDFVHYLFDEEPDELNFKDDKPDFVDDEPGESNLVVDEPDESNLVDDEPHNLLDDESDESKLQVIWVLLSESGIANLPRDPFSLWVTPAEHDIDPNTTPTDGSPGSGMENPPKFPSST